MKNTKTLRLVLGDQLNPAHSWFKKRDDSVTFLLMEVKQETDYVLHHVQKICAFFLAMRQFASYLESRGHNVLYLRLDDKNNVQSIEGNVRKIIKAYEYDRFEFILPDEYRLDRQLKKLSQELSCESKASDSEHFLTARNEVNEFFKNRKEYRMEYFYRYMRKKLNILIEENKPVGGKWNFDVENRSRYSGQVPLPGMFNFNNDATDIVDLLKKYKIKTFGDIEPERFIWPVSRAQSLKLLNHFVEDQLANFGTYQDAMTTDNWLLFHSRLSFSLNTKMIHPAEVIERVIREWEKRPEEISIAQVEGFIRQILGWREYMRGLYWKMMPEFAKMNYFGHKRKLPDFYWNGKTGMNCMKQAIGQSLKYAYAHHIQRLMVIGNFALIAGIDPVQVDAWYLGVYIDAIEWVEMPNTRGMSQFADGGITASKPYVSTANYINSMSDYCKSCHYSFRKKYGDRSCPFNSLHWNFYHRHRNKLSGNPRLGFMYKNLDKMKKDERDRILKQAGLYLDNIEDL